MKVLSENKGFTNFIIELNTRKQLFDKGIDSRGRKLSDIGGNYSGYTLQISEEKGRPKRGSDLIDLHDTGDFYNSFRVFLDGQSDFIITADTIKDTTDLLAEWGKDILGLTEESLELLVLRAKLILIPYVKSVILGTWYFTIQ